MTDGKIVPARGPPDFGWDPVFEADGFDQTYAEMDKDVKNTISHRFNTISRTSHGTGSGLSIYRNAAGTAHSTSFWNTWTRRLLPPEERGLATP